ncbi:MAG: CehA/McbA family metallohydrolase [Candidatus Methanoplasma sp.]|jgi:predicted metal-dependent phosphoesterase TrpH|nr:CehA/McbA family metallohydrolase [Candidatus Methanoplasma sp.]
MKADLHIHSVHSLNDGESPIGDIVEAALRAGLGCIAVTDHNSFESWRELSGETRVIAVPGIEVSSRDGHILAYGVDGDIPRGMSAEETIAAIHEAGGVAFAAHPYRWWSGLGEEKAANSGFDGIEAMNARSTRSGNRRAAGLAARLGKPVSAGSDAHRADRVGKCYVDIPDADTWQEVLASIMAGKAAFRGESRGALETLEYGFKSITRWIRRGFSKT